MKLENPIETERLILREFSEADFDDVREYASDPEVARFTRLGPSDPEVTREFLLKSVQRQAEENREAYELGVVLKSEGKLIGGCGLTLKDKNNGELGYILTRRYWGNGYATELARALLALGFEQLSLHRVYAVCDVRNIASFRVMEKIGMRREGIMLEDKWLRDHWRSSYLYAILEHEWRTAQ